MTRNFEFVSGPRLVYGQGSVKKIGKTALRLGRGRPFLVIDRVFEDNGLRHAIQESLTVYGMKTSGVLTDIPQDSDLAIVRQGYETAAANGADLIIAVGGGSTIDTAKGLRVMLGHGGDLPEGINVIKGALPPMIAVPTTAGTGSEATAAAVLLDHARGLKIIFTDPVLMPDIAILDPELTVSLPASLTAGTGMDALTHAVEALHSTNNQPMSDGLALHAIRLIAANLVKAVQSPGDLVARGQMLLAAHIAGLAFSNALVGMVHAAAHACGAALRIPHGTACGLLLPYGMEFNIEQCASQYAAVADALCLDVRGLDSRAAAVAAVRAIRDLGRKIGLPASLEEAGAPEDGADVFVEKTLMDGALLTNPRQPDENELREFFKRVYAGEEPCGDASGPSPLHISDTVTDETGKPVAAETGAVEKESPDKPHRKFTIDDMYRVAGAFVGKLFRNEAVTEPLMKSGLITRFIYFNEQWGDEEAVITVDCSKDPIDIITGVSDITPVVTMRMHSETARLFWLQKLNIMSAISKGDVTIKGQMNEAMRLMSVIKPGYSVFKDLVGGAKDKAGGAGGDDETKGGE